MARLQDQLREFKQSHAQFDMAVLDAGNMKGIASKSELDKDKNE